MLRAATDALLRVLALGRPRVRSGVRPFKVNVGSGLEVAPDWLHLDGSIHALFAGAPIPLLRFLYRQSHGVRSFLTEAEYVHRLSEHHFVFCNLENGLPLGTNSADFMFSSHVVEHFTRQAAARLAREMFRVLKPGGRLRIAVPDLERAVRLYQEGSKRDALHYFFTDEGARFDQHRYMYDYELLGSLLTEQGSLTSSAVNSGGAVFRT